MDNEICDICLFKFQDICDELNIPNFLMIGTALGFYRDGTYCKGDYDLDVGVQCTKEQVSILFTKLREAGFEQRELWKNQGWEINQHFWATFERKDENSIIKTKVLLDVHIQFLKDEEPFFEEFSAIEYKDRVFNLPSPIEDYLELNYGLWSVPKTGNDSRSRPLEGEREKFNGGWTDKPTPMNLSDWLRCKKERYEGDIK